MKSLSLLLVAALAACGGSKHEAAPPTPPAGSATGSAEPMMGSAEGSAGSAAATPETGSAAGSATAEGSAAGSAAPAPAPVADVPVEGGTKLYKDMDKKERAAFMKKVVLPKAKELFATIDPKMKTSCKTCHGKGFDDRSFKMPNPDIKPLPATEEAFMAWIKKNPDEGKWAKFMGEQFTPAMAKLFGMTQYDPRTKTGDFGCLACHTQQK
jgi:hypothetical protein